MFAIGLLLVVGIFILLLFLSSRVFPVGRFRTSYVLAVVGILAVYPFAHLFTPTYGAFKELCMTLPPKTGSLNEHINMFVKGIKNEATTTRSIYD
jgi:hypothetical protein